MIQLKRLAWLIYHAFLSISETCLLLLSIWSIFLSVVAASNAVVPQHSNTIVPHAGKPSLPLAVFDYQPLELLLVFVRLLPSLIILLIFIIIVFHFAKVRDQELFLNFCVLQRFLQLIHCQRMFLLLVDNSFILCFWFFLHFIGFLCDQIFLRASNMATLFFIYNFFMWQLKVFIFGSCSVFCELWWMIIISEIVV